MGVASWIPASKKRVLERVNRVFFRGRSGGGGCAGGRGGGREGGGGIVFIEQQFFFKIIVGTFYNFF